MNNALLAVALAAALVSAPALAQAPSISDQDFVAKASVGNTFEVYEAKLALETATDARLRSDPPGFP